MNFVFNKAGEIVLTDFPSDFKVKRLPLGGRYKGRLNFLVSKMYETHYFRRSMRQASSYMEKLRACEDGDVMNALATASIAYYAAPFLPDSKGRKLKPDDVYNKELQLYHSNIMFLRNNLISHDDRKVGDVSVVVVSNPDTTWAYSGTISVCIPVIAAGSPQILNEIYDCITACGRFLMDLNEDIGTKIAEEIVRLGPEFFNSIPDTRIEAKKGIIPNR